jgi:hypothetical protein
MKLRSILENNNTVAKWFYLPSRLSTQGMHHTQLATLDKIQQEMISFVESEDWDALTSYAANQYRRAKRESMYNWIANAYYAYMIVFLLLGFDVPHPEEIELLTYN